MDETRAQGQFSRETSTVTFQNKIEPLNTSMLQLGGVWLLDPLVEFRAWQPIEEGTEGNTQLDEGEYLLEVHKLTSILVGSDELVDGESPRRVAGLTSKLGQVPDLLGDIFELLEADAGQRLTTLDEDTLNPLTMLALARPLQNALPVRDDQLRLRSLGSHWTRSEPSC